jgi:shikimate kinase
VPAVVVPADPQHDFDDDALPDLAAELAADPAPHLPIVILGLMGAGKTSVATLFASRWGRALRDSDIDLEARFGRTAAVLAAELGKDGLHDLEAEHLLQALDERPAPVVAAAASTVERADCHHALGAALVVWLDGSPRTLAARHALGGHRPLYGSDVLDMLVDMDSRRRPLFEAIADVRVILDFPADPDKARGKARLAVRAGAGLADAVGAIR